ncbi:MAG TPA: Trp biosynthesis-associated membrane protein [Mycobacteriales bacterium]|nr:Trp biosynthesis-associated membrane protein [Mycobacteriales bacterium]
MVGLCAVGGGLVLGAAGQTWLRISAQRRSPLADVTLDVSGRSLAPLVAGLGVVGLAGVVGLLATRRWGRLVVAALVALSGLAVAVDALTRLGAPSAAAAQRLLEDSDRAGGLAADPVISATAAPAWPLLAALGGLLLALGGLVALLRSRGWPTMSARYETPAARARKPRTDAAVWDALSRGDDPTG